MTHIVIILVAEINSHINFFKIESWIWNLIFYLNPDIMNFFLEAGMKFIVTCYWCEPKAFDGKLDTDAIRSLLLP